MATYATSQDCLDNIEGLVIDDPVAFDRLLSRAERDIDTLLAPRSLDLTTGLRVNPVTDLEAWQTAALTRAVCAQVEYRLAQGEDFFAAAQYERVAGPDFTTDGALPYIAPKALRELDGTGLNRINGIGSVQLTARSTREYGGDVVAN